MRSKDGPVFIKGLNRVYNNFVKLLFHIFNFYLLLWNICLRIGYSVYIKSGSVKVFGSYLTDKFQSTAKKFKTKIMHITAVVTVFSGKD